MEYLNTMNFLRCGVLALLYRIVSAQSGRLMGCYRDNSSARALPERIRIPNMTPELCWQHCFKNSDRSYIGIQKDLCFCGEKYNQHGRAPDTDCETPCSGNDKQVCGGELRSLVFAVCANVLNYGKTCEAWCHCKDFASCSRNGVCPNNECEIGWGGVNCHETRPVPDQMTTSSTTLGFNITTLSFALVAVFFISTVVLSSILIKKGCRNREENSSEVFLPSTNFNQNKSPYLYVNQEGANYLDITRSQYRDGDTYDVIGSVTGSDSKENSDYHPYLSLIKPTDNN